MPKPRSRKKRPFKLPTGKLKLTALATAALVVIFVCVTAFYYFTTPANAVLITTAEPPAGLSANFTANSLTDKVVSHLNEMVDVAASNESKGPARSEGLGPRPAKQTILPIRAFSNAPSPLFDLTWKGVNLNLCRYVGMSLRAKSILEMGAVPMEGGWGLTAVEKEWPHYQPESSGNAPREGGACKDFDRCARDLAEQILKSLDERRLLNYYIKQDSAEANRRIVELYQGKAQTEPLAADDLVAWGNAFSDLRRYDDALQKFQEALRKDANSCDAYKARGFVYSTRAQGPTVLDDLQRAEQDLRKGVACDPDNVYTRTSLCYTLLTTWRNVPPDRKLPGSPLLTEAEQQCKRALELNPQFVRAGINLGYVLYRQGRHEEALRMFDELGQRHPTESALFLNHGYFLFLEYLKNGDKETMKRAAAVTLKAWEHNPKSDIAADNLGYFYYELGDYTKAVEFWKKAIELNARDPDGLTGLALGTYKLGNLEAALKHLASAVQIDGAYCRPAALRQEQALTPKAAADLAALIAASNNLCPGG